MRYDRTLFSDVDPLKVQTFKFLSGSELNQWPNSDQVLHVVRAGPSLRLLWWLCLGCVLLADGCH